LNLKILLFENIETSILVSGTMSLIFLVAWYLLK